jgi:UDP-glucose 4-epimerase
VTGGAGFIGSHLCDELLRRGHRVDAIDNLSTGSLENIEHLGKNPRFHFARATITDEIVLDRLASQADVIVHLAAAVGVQLIVSRPVHTIETNIMGTEAVLKAALRYRCRVLLASTSEVYGKGTGTGAFSEEDDVILGPTSKSRWGYAVSKMVDEFLGLAYHREYALDVVAFRLFNTVGPRQIGEYGMVLPRFVRQALTGDPITIYGDGSQSRSFCHVRDAIEAIIGLSAHDETAGKVWNVGSTHEISIRDLADRVKKLAGSASPIVYVPYSTAYAPGFEDIERRLPDIGRIGRLLSWAPRITLDEILADVIEYERGQRERNPGGAASATIEVAARRT